MLPEKIGAKHNPRIGLEFFYFIFHLILGKKEKEIIPEVHAKIVWPLKPLLPCPFSMSPSLIPSFLTV